MNPVLRIGSRDSQLALWQAGQVQEQLEALGFPSEIIPIKSAGDLSTEQPLYAMGITGIFTKALDIALLNNEVDLAVHSMKDVPTQLAKGLVQAAVLERGNPHDVLVHKGLDFLNTEGTIATSSLRRKAQWLHRYPLHEVEDLRGNVPTRLKKLDESHWNAAIFARAGLERLDILPDNATTLQWMVPAPAQGAIVVMARKDDNETIEKTDQLNCPISARCTFEEREFLRVLEGGCTAPIGAIAQVKGKLIRFRGELLSLDGSQRLDIEKELPLSESQDIGKTCAQEILDNGGKELMTAIKNSIVS